MPADCADRLSEYHYFNTATGEVCTSREILNKIFEDIIHGHLQFALSWVYSKEGF